MGHRHIPPAHLIQRHENEAYSGSVVDPMESYLIMTELGVAAESTASQRRNRKTGTRHGRQM